MLYSQNKNKRVQETDTCWCLPLPLVGTGSAFPEDHCVGPLPRHAGEWRVGEADGEQGKLALSSDDRF